MTTFTTYALYLALIGLGVTIVAALVDLGLRLWDRWRKP